MADGAACRLTTDNGPAGTGSILSQYTDEIGDPDGSYLYLEQTGGDYTAAQCSITGGALSCSTGSGAQTASVLSICPFEKTYVSLGPDTRNGCNALTLYAAPLPLCPALDQSVAACDGSAHFRLKACTTYSAANGQYLVFTGLPAYPHFTSDASTAASFTLSTENGVCRLRTDDPTPGLDSLAQLFQGNSGPLIFEVSSSNYAAAVCGIKGGILTCSVGTDQNTFSVAPSAPIMLASGVFQSGFTELTFYAESIPATSKCDKPDVSIQQCYQNFFYYLVACTTDTTINGQYVAIVGDVSGDGANARQRTPTFTSDTVSAAIFDYVQDGASCRLETYSTRDFDTTAFASLITNQEGTASADLEFYPPKSSGVESLVCIANRGVVSCHDARGETVMMLCKGDVVVGSSVLNGCVGVTFMLQECTEC